MRYCLGIAGSRLKHAGLTYGGSGICCRVRWSNETKAQKPNIYTPEPVDQSMADLATHISSRAEF